MNKNKIKEFKKRSTNKTIVLKGFVVKSLKEVESLIENTKNLLGEISYSIKKTTTGVAIVVMLAVPLVMGTGCSSQYLEIPISTEVEMVKNQSCVDEALQMYPELLQDLDELQKYLELSEELNRMGINQEVLFADNNIDSSIEEIEETIAIFKGSDKDSKLHDEAFIKLCQYQKIVNQKVIDGYSVVEEGLLVTIKAKIVDALGLGAESIENITIPNNDDVKRYITLNGDTLIEIRGKLSNATGVLYGIQRNGRGSNQSKPEYKKERNQILSKAMNELIELLNTKPVYKNGKIVSDGKLETKGLSK